MPKPSDLLAAVTAGEHRLISLQNLKHHVIKSLPVVRILDMVPKPLPHLKILGYKNNNLYTVFPLFAHWKVRTHCRTPNAPYLLGELLQGQEILLSPALLSSSSSSCSPLF